MMVLQVLCESDTVDHNPQDVLSRMIAEDSVVKDSVVMGTTNQSNNCPMCGSSIQPDWKFCPSCNSPL